MSMFTPLTTFQAPDNNFGMLPPLAAAAARAVCARVGEACPPSDALGYWDDLCRITNNLKFGQLAHSADFVSKMLNLTARLAAVLHVWESQTHYVSLSCLQRAWELVSLHATQYELVFVPPPPLPQQEADVVAVIEQLRIYRFETDYKEVPTEPIGLLLGIPSKRLRAALLRMEQRGLIELCSGKTTLINCMRMFSQSRNITWR